ncbi:hypothetical protein CAP39_12810 [Sphingomonas sp. IBVSS1]|nr:hypothetical protein CAP39_12810 [Sphingomonas sp. IBVSS1]
MTGKPNPLTQPVSQSDKAAVDQSTGWLRENAEAIRSSNAYVEKHGLPLARFRLF